MGNGVRLRIRVQPRASREELGNVRGGALVVRVTAPPVENAANAALVRLLARRLRVPASSMRIVRGGTGRDKLVEIDGVELQEVVALVRKLS
ncbi:MAG: DUF167 domain-containing protein [Vicinamibacteria bacterium]|nr:DUF167 domain-containing protein [Vicinamibacteria bacterium]